MRRSIWSGVEQDVRHAFRGLTGSPGFTLGVTLSVAVGIAANTLAFSVLNVAFLRPFPAVHAQHELARVSVHTKPRSGRFEDFQTLRRHLTGLSDLAANVSTDFAVTVDGGSSMILEGTIVSSNYFDVLGVAPAAGRFFVPEEDVEPWTRPAVVIGFGLWQRHFQGAPDVLSRQILVNGAALPIVGVTPKGFTSVTKGENDSQVWITMAMSELALRTEGGRPVNIRNHADLTWIDYVGRRKPGVTNARVQSQAAALVPAIAAARPAKSKDVSISVGDVYMNKRSDLAAAAAGFLALPMLVLAIACANAANLILSRATERGRDWIMRLALGASRWRVVRQILVESLLLASAGSAVGLLLTYWGVRVVPRAAIPIELTIDLPVLLFTMGITGLTALLFGLGPALAVTRSAARGRIGASKRDTWFGSRTRAALVALQAALCVGLLSTGAQFSKTAAMIINDHGVADPDRFLVATLDVGRLRYAPEEARAFFDRALAQVQSIPGVPSAALVNGEPWNAWDGDAMLWMPGASPAEGKPLQTMYAGGDLFGALGQSMVAGRPFSDADRGAVMRTAIVNKPFADRYLAGRALGTTLRLADASSGIPTYAQGVDVTIIGIVAPPTGLRSDKRPLIYHPLPLDSPRRLTLFARFEGARASMLPAVRSALMSIEPRLPLERFGTLPDVQGKEHAEDRWMAWAIGGLGGLALMLAAVGLYGVVSYMVTMRRREIGIRMALGSARAGVVGLILRQSLRPALLGCLAGGIGAVIVALIVKARLYGASAADPLALAGASALVLAMLIAASVIPARRASSIDPAIALRDQ
ncbi:MAG: ADOP family duplicated permease [Vicinamibacterales bacterium]